MNGTFLFLGQGPPPRSRGLMPEEVAQRLRVLERWEFSKRRVYILCDYDGPP